MFVVNDVLWVLEAVVGTQEVIDGRRLSITELMTQNDVEDLGRSFIVLGHASFT